MCVSISKCVKKLGLATALLIMLYPSMAYSQPEPASGSQVSDQILVIVNNDVITAGELDKQVKLLQVQGRLPETLNKEIVKQVLDSVVNEYAQLQRAAQMRMMLNNAEKEQSLQSFLATQKLSQTQLNTKLKDKDLSLNDLRERLANSVLIQRLVRADVGRSVFVGDDEIANFVKTNKIKASTKSYAFSYLRIKKPSNDTAQNKTLLNAVGASIANNSRSSLSKLERSLKQKGINVSKKSVAMTDEVNIPDAFLSVLKDIKKGQLSKLLKSPSGFYVLQLDGIKGSVDGPEKRKGQHILIEAKSPLEFERAKLQVRNFKQQVIDGVSFDSLAQYYSDDSGSAAKGGNIGWIERGVMVPEFEQSLFSLNKGELSDPVVSPFGVHLIRLNDITRKQEPEEQVRAIAYNALMTQKVQQYYPAWLSELVGRAYIRYM